MNITSGAKLWIWNP